jgi:hypothetical protein
MDRFKLIVGQGHDDERFELPRRVQKSRPGVNPLGNECTAYGRRVDELSR